MRMIKKSCIASLLLLLFGSVAWSDQADSRYTLSFGSFSPLNSDIFIANADGSGARVLFANAAQEFNAVFAPDGKWIVFTSTRNGSADLYRANVDGSGLERLVGDAAYDDQAAISPDGKSVAFVSSRGGNADIFILDLASKSVRNVTNNSEGDFRPAWSPDGRWLAFTSDRNSKKPVGPGGFAIQQSTEIYVMRVDGSDLRQITRFDEFAGSPRWSNDGKRLVFYHADMQAAGNIVSPQRLRGTTQICEVDLATGAWKALTKGDGEKRSPQFIAADRIGYASDGPTGGIEIVDGVPGARGEFKNPTWSADGKHMLFQREVDQQWPPHQPAHSLDPRFQLIRVGVFSSWSPRGDRMVSNDQTAGILHNSVISMRPDGAGRTTLFTDPVKSALAPVWSRQGDRIAFGLGRFFQGTNGPAQADIVTMRNDGQDRQVLTDGRSNYGFPSFSPDGKHIVYREASRDHNALYIVDVATRERRVLIEGPAHYNFPGWSPTADVIAFTSNMDGNYDIYAIAVDGSNLKRLTHSPHVEGHSSWSADGKWLAFSSGVAGFKDEFLLFQANPQAYGEVHVMRADGREDHALTDNQFEEATIGWVPQK